MSHAIRTNRYEVRWPVTDDTRTLSELVSEATPLLRAAVADADYTRPVTQRKAAS